ncbi:MAG: hypothetical protein K0R47_5417 [Brevibacillus sp.]|jgi:hypothetical protein|nr:hypothetical protein [Brevibacillus sp.]
MYHSIYRIIFNAMYVNNLFPGFSLYKYFYNVKAEFPIVLIEFYKKSSSLFQQDKLKDDLLIYPLVRIKKEFGR